MGKAFPQRFIALAVAAIVMAGFWLLQPRPAQGAWSDSWSEGYHYYYWNSNPKFRFHGTNTYWDHYSTIGSTWYRLSASGMTDTNIGNGAWHDLGTGLKYSYATSTDYGYFIKGASYRFYYRYAPGQWYTSGSGGGWYLLGAAGRCAGLVDGNWYDLGTGLNYKYTASTDYGFFSKRAAYRFYYRYAPGQWYTSGSGGGWYLLGASGTCAGLADGNWHSLGAGLSYKYTASTDYGFFSKGASYRFYYNFEPGQWYNSGSGGGWYLLGAAGRCAGLADGNWYDLGTGLKYRYDAPTDYGFFMKGTAYRFYYRYAPGQWYTSGFGGGWYLLGDAETNAGCVADGAFHVLGSGWSYQYYGGTIDEGYWSIDGGSTGVRFAYEYDVGTWHHRGYGDSWHPLSEAGLSASFMGTNAHKSLGNGFWYRYSLALDYGYWSVSDSIDGLRFTYIYFGGTWYHRGYDGVLHGLVGGASAKFMGDQEWHPVTDGFSYRYLTGSDDAYWSRDGTDETARFHYWYQTGQWEHKGALGDWSNLGASGRGAARLYDDAAWHDLGDGYSYKYAYTADTGAWSRDGTDAGLRLRYGYTNLNWWQYGPAGYSWLNEPTSTDMTADFVGDGAYHLTGPLNGRAMYFKYVRTSDEASWSQTGTSAGDRFRYQYGSGLWQHKGVYGDFGNLGHAGMSPRFLGDGENHDLYNGNYYQWDSTSQWGIWQTDSFVNAYAYDYIDGWWYFWDHGWINWDGPGVGTTYNPGEP